MLCLTNLLLCFLSYPRSLPGVSLISERLVRIWSETFPVLNRRRQAWMIDNGMKLQRKEVAPVEHLHERNGSEDAVAVCQLSEKDRYAGVEAAKLGHGGMEYISALFRH